VKVKILAPVIGAVAAATGLAMGGLWIGIAGLVLICCAAAL
jgi:hypothetical protein